MAEHRKTIAAIVAEVRACPPGVAPTGLTSDQVNDLYYFKNRLAASLHRLYTKMPEHTADQIIGRILKDVLAEIDHGGG